MALGRSLLQGQMKIMEVQTKALRALKGVSRDPHLDLVAVALHGREVNFDTVIAMLGKEQKDDEDKKAYFETELDTANDEREKLKRNILEKAIEENKAAVDTLTTAIADLEQGVNDLDKQVAEATEQRIEEHQDFAEILAVNNAAQDCSRLLRTV